MTADIRPPAQITPEWLSAVLAKGGVDARVQSFTAKRVGTGQIGDTYRFDLIYNRKSKDTPNSLVGKFPSDGTESRQTGITLGNYLREVKFYQHLAATALIHTPRVYFTDINEATHDFVLIMEDLSPAEQGDQLKGVSLHQAHLVMDEAAKLHASHWEDEGIDKFAWVSGTSTAASAVSPELITGLWHAFCARYGERVTGAAKNDRRNALRQH